MPRGAKRVEEFLESGLDRRPVAVAWHRAYQAVAGLNGHGDGLLALYDRYLSADPESGALLYLRGRIEPDEHRQGDFYRRSIEADPRSPWPWMALGARAALARSFPALRAEYDAAAVRFDVRRTPAYQLVRRAIEAPTAKAP